MSIFYMMVEARLLPENEESKELGGAYINCWIKSKDEPSAKRIVSEYVFDEGWEIIDIEKSSVVTREIFWRNLIHLIASIRPSIME